MQIFSLTISMWRKSHCGLSAIRTAGSAAVGCKADAAIIDSCENPLTGQLVRLEISSQGLRFAMRMSTELKAQFYKLVTL